jgi:hypothetical protein
MPAEAVAGKASKGPRRVTCRNVEQSPAFGVGFADGPKATNLERHRDFENGSPPDPPALRLVRWEGYDLLSQEVDLWVWGLPPPGPLAFVCPWPADQASTSGVEMDASLVLEAARRATPVWPAG